MAIISNRLISDRLNEYATLLAQQGANQFRINAYQRAAITIDGLQEDVSEIYRRGGAEALIALPNIGKGIAAAVAELLHSGKLTRLERLRGALEPSELFATLPGIGPKLAQRIHDELGIDSLEALEVAAHDGRLESIPGFGHGRAEIVRAALQTLLTTPRAAFHHDISTSPDIGLLLEIDHTYRKKAERGELPTIAPKRFNPQRKAWLPIMHENIGNWHFTVLFSNTARAHQLKRTHDWVVVYFYNDHHEEGQHTIVTESKGPLKGRRVVRGREQECQAYYS